MSSAAAASNSKQQSSTNSSNNNNRNNNNNVTFTPEAKQVISAVAPLLSSLAHFVGEKLGEPKIRQSVPEYIVKDAEDAHARAGRIDKVWQSILSTGGGGMKLL
jgi:hypothetical protein